MLLSASIRLSNTRENILAGGSLKGQERDVSGTASQIRRAGTRVHNMDVATPAFDVFDVVYN